MSSLKTDLEQSKTTTTTTATLTIMPEKILVNLYVRGDPIYQIKEEISRGINPI